MGFFIGAYEIINDTLGNCCTCGNVSMGYLASNSQVTGFGNTAIGPEALNLLTSGVCNTVVGAQAGTKITTGGRNVLIGAYSGRYVNTGLANIFIGTNAGEGAIGTYAGSCNIAIGYCAMATAATGAPVGNIFIGTGAGSSLTSGNYNVAIGKMAGNNITTGSCNIIIGTCNNSRVGATAVGCIDIAAGYCVTTYTSPPYVHINSTGIGLCHSSPAAVLHICKQLIVSLEVIAYYSDRRLKENIEPITNALAKINQINGISYNPNRTAIGFGFEEGKKQVGVIADEVEKVLPEVVVPAPFDISADKISISGENYKTVKYEKLVPLLIEAVKELKIKFDNLTYKNTQYKKQNQK